ncbi:unnamed protein product [Blumeria hordei]|uniref:Uncharacterized protein n=1 Tax=Blumeria hordei TaxID=2867405 RepID=A0A383UPC3_BLUHO|nr:unnamed protein product [Blumeria hordei]
MLRYSHEAGLVAAASRPQAKWQGYFAGAPIGIFHEITVASLRVPSNYPQNEAKQWRARLQRRNLDCSIMTNCRFFRD